MILRKPYRPMPRDLRSIEGFVPTGNTRASITIDPGSTYHQLELVTNITDAALIKEVELELNGDTIITLTGQEMKMLEAYKKHHSEAGRYIIPFSLIEAKTSQGVQSSELVTMAGDNITLWIDVGDLSGVDKPFIRGRAKISSPQPVRYYIPRIYRFNLNASASGRNDHQWQKKGAEFMLRRVHCKTDGDVITRLEIQRDNTIVYENNASDNVFDLRRDGSHAGRAPQNGYFHFDPIASGHVMEGLFPTQNQSIVFRFTVSEPTNIQCLVEEAHQVAPLPNQVAK